MGAESGLAATPFMGVSAPSPLCTGSFQQHMFPFDPVRSLSLGASKQNCRHDTSRATQSAAAEQNTHILGSFTGQVAAQHGAEKAHRWPVATSMLCLMS